MKVFQKLLAAAGVAAIAATAIPMGNAQAASNCTHKYREYCLGFYSYTQDTHEYNYYEYDGFFQALKRHSATCVYKEITHGDRTECANCGALTGGIGTHRGSVLHLSCSETKHICSGTGSDVTLLY
ncbi:MAG: hypothetical protein ACI4QX_08385 [Lachnospiraceae bacterium]